jgi:phage terminase large subunit
MIYNIAEISSDSTGGYYYQPFGGAVDFWRCKEQEVILSGPAECLAGETVIDGTGMTIAELEEDQISPVVHTLQGQVKAETPFIKGISQLYEVTLENGKKFSGTLGHLVLTTSGWCQVGQLRHSVSCVATIQNICVQWSKVSSIKYAGTHKYYDLHVPGVGHYFANGILHHNTGKTLAACHKMDALAWKYKGFQGAIVRAAYKSMPGSVLQTFEQKVLGAWNPDLNGFDQNLTPVKKYGGQKAEWYDYPNKSRIWTGGLDNATKVLSSERDAIYVNQAEEITLDQWETLGTRVTGRAGNMPYAQLLGDCNPGARQHWIKLRVADAKLVLLESRHRDNPTLYDPHTGLITEQGKRTMAVLDNLTGVRRSRYRDGLWVSAEGQIYDTYDPAVHIVDRFDIPPSWRRFRVVDFGLVHPLVCQWWAEDEDGRMYMYREIYMTGRTVATHSVQIKKLSEGERITATICDHDAEDRETLRENGIPNIPAKKSVSIGIGKVQDRLALQKDGRPRLFFMRDSLVEVDQTLKLNRQPYRTVDEIEGYIWQNSLSKEEPVKAEDDGMDCTRYAVMYLDKKGSFFG